METKNRVERLDRPVWVINRHRRILCQRVNQSAGRSRGRRMGQGFVKSVSAADIVEGFDT